MESADAIRSLRERAKKELGDKFDIRGFHDEVLDGGALPLDVLEVRINSWIATQKQPASKVASVNRTCGNE